MDVKYPEFVSKFARQFISSLLKKKAARRMPLSRVPEHPWIVHELSTKVGKPKPKLFPKYLSRSIAWPSREAKQAERARVEQKEKRQ